MSFQRTSRTRPAARRKLCGFSFLRGACRHRIGRMFVGLHKWLSRRDESFSILRGAMIYRVARGMVAMALAAFGGNCWGSAYLRNQWMLHTGTSSESCPAIASDGTIYFGTSIGRLWAVAPHGSRNWIVHA